MAITHIYFLLCLSTIYLVESLSTDPAQMRSFLVDYNDKAVTVFNRVNIAYWDYYTNLTDKNSEIATQADIESANFTKWMAAEANKFNWKDSTLSDTEKRQFRKITEIGFTAVDDLAKIEKKSELEFEMTDIYWEGKVCLTDQRCLELNPDLTDLLASSRDYDELLAIWKGWRDQKGKKMREKYTEFVNVMNDAIRFNGFNDTGEYWRSWYEDATFESDVQQLYEEFRPLYEQLQAYTRRKLMDFYGKERFPDSGHIPAHLFGNMWSQAWSNIYSLLTPYPNAVSIDITQKMKATGYNVTYMFQVAEEFFTSIGFDALPESFWTKSMLKKPVDRDVDCLASAWDFYDGHDFRIQQCTCTTVTQAQFLTAHQQMGHLIYNLAYKNQPIIFRDGGNPGFHSAMADIVSLSFQTPEHMKEINLIDTVPTDTESDINLLMQMALEKIAFLPFGYLIDQWRWSVFRGDTTPNNYTASWWELRCSYQGISPPVARTEEDFDPGAKYHIPGNTPYIRYFVSYVIQFQWQKALCDEIGYTGPLHRCNIYGNPAAGAKLRKMLEMGSSKPWQDVMEVLTGVRKMSALPLVEYFTPLINWLKEQNKEENIGWSASCPSSIPSAGKTTNTGPEIHMQYTTLLILVLIAFFR